MLGPLLGGAGGAATGGILGTGARQGGGFFDLLAPLDYPRQALWNVPSALSKGDFLGALPGLFGGAAGLGLAATGAGLPMALLGGSALGGLAQGAGRSTGSESFDAPTPSALLEALGGDPEGTGGMLGSMALGALGDPLMWSEMGLGIGRMKPRTFKGGLPDIPIPPGSEVLGAKPMMGGDIPPGPLGKMMGSRGAAGGSEAVDAALEAGANPEQLEKAAGAGYAARNKDLAQKAVDYAKLPEGTPLAAKPTTAPAPLKGMEAEGVLRDYLTEHGSNADPAVVHQLAEQMHAGSLGRAKGGIGHILGNDTLGAVTDAGRPHMNSAWKRFEALSEPSAEQAAQAEAEQTWLERNMTRPEQDANDMLDAARASGELPPLIHGRVINPNASSADLLENPQHSALLQALARATEAHNPGRMIAEDLARYTTPRGQI
jgi:hypothetical protein